MDIKTAIIDGYYCYKKQYKTTPKYIILQSTVLLELRKICQINASYSIDQQKVETFMGLNIVQCRDFKDGWMFGE